MSHKSREDRLAYSKKYYALNKDRLKERATEWNRNNPDKRAVTSRKSYIKNRAKNHNNDVVKRLLLSSKQRAAKKRLEHTLVYEDIIIPKVCPVLGIELVLTLKATEGHKVTHPYAPSIDRFDNSKGYTKDNIRIISHRANAIKGDATVEELEAVLQYCRNASA